MSPVVGANLVLRFAFELAALAALAYWGTQAIEGPLRWALAAGSPLLFALAWGLVVSPKAPLESPLAVRFAVELALMGGAAAALAAAWRPLAGLVFFLVALGSGAANLAPVSSGDRRRRS